MKVARGNFLLTIYKWFINSVLKIFQENNLYYCIFLNLNILTMRKIFTLILFYPIFSLAQWGSIDESFGENGISITTIPESFLPIYNFVTSIQDSDGNLFVVGNYMVQDDGLGNFQKLIIFKFSEGGILDESFGENGMKSIEISNGSTLVNNMIFTNDLKLLLVGNWKSHANGSLNQMFLMKLNLDGSFDNTFSDNGIYVSQNQEFENGLAVIQDLNNNYYIAGQRYEEIYNYYKKYVLSKFSNEGDLVQSFGNNGYISEIILSEVTPTDLKIYNNQIYMLGIALNNPNVSPFDHDILVKRFDLNGNVDANFGSGGNLIVSIDESDIDGYSLDFGSSGEIYVGGTIYDNTILNNFFVSKFTNNGTLMEDFGHNGFAYFVTGNDYGKNVHFVATNNIIVTGFKFDNALAYFNMGSFNSEGELNNLFGIDGFVTTDVVSEVGDRTFKSLMVDNEKLVLFGRSGNNLLSMVRYNVVNDMSVEDVNSNPSYKILPNPTSNSFKIIGLKGSENQVQLFDLSGKLLKKFKAVSEGQILELDGISKGTYLIKILSDNQIDSKKLIVK
jgi:uncharacterized delta-60 repeat protein